MSTARSIGSPHGACRPWARPAGVWPALGRLFAAALTSWIAAGMHGFAGEVTRQLPAHFVPGVAFTVSITVEPAATEWAYAVEEQPPPGWAVANINRHGRWDAVTGRVKWGPFNDNAVRILTYELTPPAAAATAHGEFTGVAAFGSIVVPVQGASSIQLQPSRVTRALPDHFEPAVPFLARWIVEPRQGVSVHAVEDQLPQGWSAQNLSHGGQFDAINRKLKWGPFADALERTLEAELIPPADASTAVFLGTARFDDQSATIAGHGQLHAEENVAFRVLPTSYVRGQPLEVIMELLPAGRIKVFAVQEQIPDDWIFQSASDGGEFDPVTRRIKWGPFQDAQDRTLRYQILAPAAAAGPAVFAGEAVFDATAVIVAGPSELNPARSTLTRVLPPTITPGVGFTLTLNAEPATGVQAYAVEETLPAGWHATSVSHGGQFDVVTGKVKWGPYTDGAVRALTCEIQAPAAAAGEGVFNGLGIFDTTLVPTDGPSTTRGGNHVLRQAPAGFRDGQPLQVSLQTRPLPHVTVYSVEETIPEGWTVTSASDGGVFDDINRRVKWGPFEEATPRTLVLELIPPATPVAEVVTFAGQAVFDDVAVETDGPKELTRLPNQAPLVVDVDAQRPPDRSIKIAAAKLLALGSDPDGGTLSLVSVDPVSAGGAQVFIAGTWIVYLPPGGFHGTDTFSYTLSDGQGSVESAILRVHVADVDVPRPPNALRVTVLPDGSARVDFIGIPGRTYHVQASSDLVDWTTIGSATAGDLGLYSFIDTEASLFPTRYYRSNDP